MRMMRVSELAAAYGVPRGRIERMISSGLLRAVRIGEAVLVDADEADAVLRGCGAYGSGDRYMGMAELMERTGLTRHQINVLRESGRIQSVSRSGRRLYDIEAVERAIKGEGKEGKNGRAKR